MITKFGKRFLTSFIAGTSSLSSKEMAIGIANGSALEYPLSDTNSRLGFEFYRVPIRQGGIDIDPSTSPVTYTVIFSATLPKEVSGKINEVGIYSGQSYSSNLYGSRFISDFELPYEWTPEPDLDQTNSRILDSSLIFTSNSTSPREYTYPLSNLDISGYNPLDTLCLSYRANDANLSSIKVRLYTSDLDYMEFTFSGHVVGNNIKSLYMSEGVITGTFNSQNVTKLGVVVTPTSSQTSVSMDGLRINDEDTFDPEYGLIARSILTSEMVKIVGREASIEFKLDLSFGS
jgi:hypothetical protein